jgi:hypothetical protein
LGSNKSFIILIPQKYSEPTEYSKGIYTKLRTNKVLNKKEFKLSESGFTEYKN